MYAELLVSLFSIETSILLWLANVSAYDCWQSFMFAFLEALEYNVLPKGVLRLLLHVHDLT
jgi:hypothetical protein